MASLKALKALQTLQNPVVVGPLLWALTKGPAPLRESLTRTLEKLLSPANVVRFISALRVTFWIGVVGKVNARLNDWALNNWQWKAQTDKWDFKREVAVVTGGCSGIGLETVKCLMRKGVKTAVFDVAPLPKEIENYGNIKYFYCDVTTPSSISDAAHSLRLTWGDPTILINNAGVGNPHSILETSNEWITKIFQINIISHFWLVKEFMPDMVKKNKGHIVGLASMASFIAPPGIVDYASTKAAVLAFHEGLNMEIKHIYKTPGVLNTIVHPSWVRTPLVGGYENHLEKTQGKLMKPEHIAKRITDQIFSCRGGQLIMPSRLAIASTIRANSNWLQEIIRDIAVGGAASQFPDGSKAAGR